MEQEILFEQRTLTGPLHSRLEMWIVWVLPFGLKKDQSRRKLHLQGPRGVVPGYSCRPYDQAVPIQIVHGLVLQPLCLFAGFIHIAQIEPCENIGFAGSFGLADTANQRSQHLERDTGVFLAVRDRPAQGFHARQHRGVWDQ